MKTQIRNVLASLGCAVALSLSAIAPAQAAIIVGTFDPAFGNGFTGLGWSGRVEFFVPEACLNPSASTTGQDHACDAAEITSAYVDLYALTGIPQSERLNFMTDTLRMSIWDVTVSGGTVTGLNTGLERLVRHVAVNTWYQLPNNEWTFNTTYEDQWRSAYGGDWANPAGTLTSPAVAEGYKNYDYGLFLRDGVAELHANSHTLVNFGVSGAPNIQDTTFGCPYDGDYAICVSEVPPTITFTRLDPPPTVIPEPSSIALFFGALGAAGWVRRRKSRQD